MEFIEKIVVSRESMSWVGYPRVVEGSMVLLLHPEGVRNVLAVVFGRINQLAQLLISVYLGSRDEMRPHLMRSLLSTRRSSSLFSTGTGFPSISFKTRLPIEFVLRPFFTFCLQGSYDAKCRWYCILP